MPTVYQRFSGFWVNEARFHMDEDGRRIPRESLKYNLYEVEAEPRSLADTEPAENHSEQVIRTEFARDGIQLVLREPKLFSE